MKEKDEILIQHTLDGDLEAFGKLIDRYKDAVFALALHRVKNFEDARDIAQEAFIKAYINLSELRDISSFVSWLKKITLSVASHWLRGTSKRNEVFIADIPDYENNPTYWSILQSPEMPDEKLERKEFQEQILSALDSLSEANRLTTILYYVDGLSYDEIARFQDIPLSSVKGRLYQSRKKLKEEMINMLERTLKKHAPGKEFTESVLSDLEIVNQQLGGEAKLIAREERIGNIKCTAVWDLNNDGKEEIIIGTDIGIVMVLSLFGEEIWRKDFSEEITELLVKDGTIFVGTKGLIALDSDGSIIWTYPDENVKSLAIADLTDGGYEIATLTGKIRIFSSDGKVVSEFEYKAESNRCGCGCSGDIGRLAVGDADGDSVYEIGVTSRDTLCLFKRNGDLLWSRTARGYKEEYSNPAFWSFPIAMADINDDGKAELLAGCCSSLVVIDGNGQDVWHYTAQALYGLRCIAIGDINSDGKKEIAVGTSMFHFGVFRNNGELLWYHNIGSGISSLAMADINNDGKDEVIVEGEARSADVVAFDGEGELLWKYHTGFGVSSLTCCDVDKDGKVEIIVGSDDLHLISSNGERQWMIAQVLGSELRWQILTEMVLQRSLRELVPFVHIRELARLSGLMIQDTYMILQSKTYVEMESWKLLLVAMKMRFICLMIMVRFNGNVKLHATMLG